MTDEEISRIDCSKYVAVKLVYHSVGDVWQLWISERDQTNHWFGDSSDEDIALNIYRKIVQRMKIVRKLTE